MQTGDEERFKHDLLSFVPRLRAFACSLARTHAAGEDLAQETVMRAWRGRDGFTPGTNMEAWLFRILRNVHISGVRRVQRSPMMEMDDRIERVAASADDPGAALDLDDLRRAMNRLPVEQREALILVGASGWSYEEAAAHAGCPLGTMKSRVFRARRTLAADIATGKAPRGSAASPDAMTSLMALAEAAETRPGSH